MYIDRYTYTQTKAYTHVIVVSIPPNLESKLGATSPSPFSDLSFPSILGFFSSLRGSFAKGVFGVN